MARLIHEQEQSTLHNVAAFLGDIVDELGCFATDELKRKKVAYLTTFSRFRRRFGRWLPRPFWLATAHFNQHIRAL
ncbi:MAG TPA: hypothetical protein VFQ60_03640 [Patescibacteria group bacterium]|nr:hypothetical protein [Patescibacteria group bacterium]